MIRILFFPQKRDKLEANQRYLWSHKSHKMFLSSLRKGMKNLKPYPFFVCHFMKQFGLGFIWVLCLLIYLCMHLRSCYKAVPGHILDHLQILPETSPGHYSSRNGKRSKQKGTEHWKCLVLQAHSGPETNFVWHGHPGVSPLTRFRDWSIWHSRNWDFFSFEKRFQSGICVCKCLSACINTSWKGVKKWSQTLLSGTW